MSRRPTDQPYAACPSRLAISLAFVSSTAAQATDQSEQPSFGKKPTDRKSDVSAWLRERRMELWILVGLWAVATAVIYALAVGHEAPRRYQDEFLFWALAKNFAAGDGLIWRDVGIGMRSWLYPVLLAPAFWFNSTISGEYTGVHLLNSMMMAGTVFPAYLLARMFVCRWKSLLAAVFVLSAPAVNYAGIIGSENLGYLTCTAAFAAIVLALARPRPRNWALALAMIAVAILTRTQFLILLPILGLTLLLVAAMRGRNHRAAYLREQKGLLVTLVAVAVVGGLYFLVQGRGAIGIYGGVFDGVPLTWDATKYWVKAFSADVYLLAAIVPVIATFAMFGHGENRRDPLVGALIALGLVAAVAFVAQVAWFSATNPYDWRTRNIFYERYMFYLGPIFFTGLLVAWRRASVGSAVISVAIATLIVSGFQTDAVLVPFSYDSFGLSLVGRHMQLHPDDAAKIGMLLARLTLLFGVVYIVSTLPKLVISRVAYWLAVAITLGALIATQAQTWHYARTFSAAVFEGVPKPATFIDQNTDQDVGMIITSTDSPELYFGTEFWNNRITRAFVTDIEPIKSPIVYSPTCLFDWSRSGDILGTGCDKVPNAWFMRSDSVSIHFKDEFKRVHPNPSTPSMTLMVAGPPPSLLSIVSGRDVRNGVVQGAMHVKTFLAHKGELRLRFGPATEAHLVQIGDGPTVRVPASGRRWVRAKIPKNEHESRVSIKTIAGLPSDIVANRIEVREAGGGDWIGIE